MLYENVNYMYKCCGPEVLFHKVYHALVVNSCGLVVIKQQATVIRPNRSSVRFLSGALGSSLSLTQLCCYITQCWVLWTVCLLKREHPRFSVMATASCVSNPVYSGSGKEACHYSNEHANSVRSLSCTGPGSAKIHFRFICETHLRKPATAWLKLLQKKTDSYSNHY